MGIKILFSAVLVIFISLILILYWFVPFNVTEFTSKTSSNNFSIDNLDTRNMQFFQNMRFPYTEISYKINNCSIYKKDDMLRAFTMVTNKSLLNFYSVEEKEDITIECEDKNKEYENMFIAGEGGPTNITVNKNFNVISHGDILLIRDSPCPKPQVALHELFHVLGFNHSNNPDNIMYPISDCSQEMSEDMFELLDNIYDAPSYPDLEIENVSAIMHGKYIDVNISIRNNGLIPSREYNLIISSDEKIIRDIDLESLKSGHGIELTLTNTWVSKINIENLEFQIYTEFNELNKQNNKVILQIKK